MPTNRQTVHLYCLCWNDARMLPFFFQHYDRFVDRYFIHDNGSTDGSLSILTRHHKVELFHFDVPGNSFVDEERRLGDTIWKGSEADWVIVTDIDEFVYRPRLLNYLERCKRNGVTAIQTIGYEMISATFPAARRSLVGQITEGARSTGHDRLCIFNPEAIAETNFTPGRHQAAPQGRVVWPVYSEVLLLHYKQLGVEYTIARSAELLKGIREGDIENGWGFQYSWTARKIQENWDHLKELAGPVPGLGPLKHMPPSRYGEEERVIQASGLLDPQWYLSTYPDVDSALADPHLHFCIHGCREGRRPNFYFDPEWYSANYADLLPDGRNPLFDYIVRGEAADAWPSPLFNTAWYRDRHGLAPSESPLGHYLNARKDNLVSPLPEFDAQEYCRLHPEVAAARDDPFESYCRQAG